MKLLFALCLGVFCMQAQAQGFNFNTVIEEIFASDTKLEGINQDNQTCALNLVQDDAHHYHKIALQMGEVKLSYIYNYITPERSLDLVRINGHKVGGQNIEESFRDLQMPVRMISIGQWGQENEDGENNFHMISFLFDAKQNLVKIRSTLETSIPVAQCSIYNKATSENRIVMMSCLQARKIYQGDLVFTPVVSNLRPYKKTQECDLVNAEIKKVNFDIDQLKNLARLSK